MKRVHKRIARYITEYAQAARPGIHTQAPAEADLLRAERDVAVRRGQHADGEHIGHQVCPYRSATECGERAVAAEYVQTH